jgi:putative transposase
VHVRTVRVRRDHARKTGRSLVERFDVLYIEDLNICGLAKSSLAKHVNDQAWGAFTRILADKAEEAGRLLVKVDPRGSSQECSGCRTIVPKTLAARVHACRVCGLVCGTSMQLE